MMEKERIRQLILEILQEEISAVPVKHIPVKDIMITEKDKLHTGNPADRVYTRDLMTIEESPRLGCGIMEMEQTTFPWQLQYDEIDYVIEGTLQIVWEDHTITAGPGEVIYIPKNSSIQFSAKDKARFLYITYPADWKNQK